MGCGGLETEAPESPCGRSEVNLGSVGQMSRQGGGQHRAGTSPTETCRVSRGEGGGLEEAGATRTKEGPEPC